MFDNVLRAIFVFGFAESHVHGDIKQVNIKKSDVIFILMLKLSSSTEESKSCKVILIWSDLVQTLMKYWLAFVSEAVCYILLRKKFQKLVHKHI